MIQADPRMAGIQRIGHDLDDAVGNGLGFVFRHGERLYCTQHVQNRDSYKLKQLGANIRTTNRIMSDIYGTQNGFVAEFGLADASDPEDFEVKLESLQSIWESLIPGFHAWFRSNRSTIFKSNLVLSARKHLNIKGRFYSNTVESEHRLQKKYLAEEFTGEKDVVHVNRLLVNFIDEFYTELVRSIRGLGRYRLAPGYEQFFVEPHKWNQWSVERRQQHIDVFLSFSPSAAGSYSKPAAAGLKKAPRAKRRIEKGEPELFVERIQTSIEAVTPIKISKKKGKDEWKVTKNGAAANDDEVPTHSRYEDQEMDPLNPDRPNRKSFYLVHRKDSKNCPLSVKRCHVCKRLFGAEDWVVVKTEGVRSFTDSKGNSKTSVGNVYIHHLRGCLAEFQQNFDFNMVIVLLKTLELLPASAEKRLRCLGCKFE